MMISANLGDGAAKAQIGLCYLSGEGVTKNEQEAFQWFICAANQDDVLGQFCLGNCYLHGQGTEKNIQSAIIWLRKAANTEFQPAINTLNEITK